MENTKATVLKELLDAIDSKNFDLESWKIKASHITKKIFGNNDEKVLLIRNLQYDYSSWSLRDHSGGKQNDSVKEKAREIMETALLELKLSDNHSDVILKFKDQLTGAQFNSLQSLMESAHENPEKLKSFISTIQADIKDEILVQLLNGE